MVELGWGVPAAGWDEGESAPIPGSDSPTDAVQRHVLGEGALAALLSELPWISRHLLVSHRLLNM
jgi:hypothetical protein